MTMGTRKVGLIGTGYWSEKHLAAWARIPGVEIAALCNRSRDKLERRAEQFGIPSERLYDSADRMLAEAGLDIVDIVTGPDTHAGLVGLAAASGSHILCQKPFARSVAEAEAMADAAERAGVRLMVTENWRWLLAYQTVKQVLDSGTIGTLRAARYSHSDFYTPRMAPGETLPQPFFRDMPRLLFYEMGAHWFDTWRFLFGTPRRLYAELATISPYVRGDDAGVVLFGYDNGFLGHMDMSWATRRELDLPPGAAVGPVHRERLTVDGDDGSLKLYADGRVAVVSGDGRSETAVAETGEWDHAESHFRLQSHFVDCLESGEPFQTSGADNVLTMKLLFGAYESAATHKPILFGDPESADPGSVAVI